MVQMYYLIIRVRRTSSLGSGGIAIFISQVGQKSNDGKNFQLIKTCNIITTKKEYHPWITECQQGMTMKGHQLEF